MPAAQAAAAAVKASGAPVGVGATTPGTPINIVAPVPGDAGSTIVTGPTTVTDRQAPSITSNLQTTGIPMADAIQAGLFGFFQNAGKAGFGSLSGLLLFLLAMFAILIGAIIWRGDDVKRYAPDAAFLAATA